jgi:uncharacterized membrane protein
MGIGKMFMRIARLSIVSALLVATLALPALAQEAVMSITTPYVGVSVSPGDTATFDVDVTGPVGDSVALELKGLPDGWTGQIRGGGFLVDRVQVGTTGELKVTLSVDVPAEAAEGRSDLSLVASDGTTTDTLDLSVTVAETAGGAVSLDTDFPALRGASDATFSFNVQLDNSTPQDIQFGLSTDAPEGWQATATPSGEAKASTLTVAAGATGSFTVDVDPPDTTPAGTYTITARAEGSGQSAEVELSVEITGTFDMQFTTQSEVLNFDVRAGQSTELPMVLINSGTAPLEAVNITATPPRGWTIDFDPTGVDTVAPGESVPVTATVTPADDAINGDYLLNFLASTPEARSSTDVRATVKTSAVWGVVGIAIIVLALAGLSLVFRQFGRR